jgi:hypothetical protein
MLFTIRTSNRSPKKNYVGLTVASLVGQGVPVEAIHLVPTDIEKPWLQQELGPHRPTIHWPLKKRLPNQNALAQIDLLSEFPADWIVMSEDDLEWCADPLGTIKRWLDVNAHPNRLFYRFFAFGELKPFNADAYESPLKEQKGSQAVAMRAENAVKFASWARANPLHWRPPNAPFQDRPHDGFDKLLGYWALQERPKVTTGLVSKPFFVRHLGVQSAIHSHGLRRDNLFGGASWSYRRPA